MSFSYDSSLGSDIDKVRFLLQDNVASTADLEDEEITFLLASYGSVSAAALAGARTLHGKYSKLVDRMVGDMRIWYGMKARAWLQTIRQLESNANALSPIEVYVGGIDHDEELSDRQNESLSQPRFRVGMHDLMAPLDVLRADL